MEIVPFCPICGSTRFEPFNGRPRARCSNCRAVERTRILYSVLNREGVLRNGMQILHVAPETGLIRRLKSLAGRYVPADRDVSRFAKLLPEAKKIDLCSFETGEWGTFDLVLHMHVLAQLPCDPAAALARLAATLAPGGTMYFSVPIRRDSATVQDPTFSMRPDERKSRFGHEDNWRMFGDSDAERVLGARLPGRLEVVDLSAYLGAEDMYLAALVPAKARITSDTIFRYRNPVGDRRQYPS
jgi:SAM-dependent methyltransferase